VVTRVQLISADVRSAELSAEALDTTSSAASHRYEKRRPFSGGIFFVR
jgi:hypothetical protein